MKLNNTKETKDMLKTSVTIIAVTLALVTAGIVVVISTMPVIQTAHASCITGPKGDRACSGGGSPFHGVSSSSE